MKEVSLTRGMVALIDDADAELVEAFNWRAEKGTATFYARKTGPRPERIQTSMHRLILGLERGDRLCCDHIDGNGLNNQRHNLRVATYKQNAANRTASRNALSHYNGVTLDKRVGKWRAQIQSGGKSIWLGQFATELQAAEAYDLAAVKVHGEYAKLNLK
jgi:hypothetical protein